MKTTGEILKKKREMLGITAEKLGELTEVSQAYVTMVENNNTKPSKAYLAKIKEILHITESEEKNIIEFEEFRRLPQKYQQRLLSLNRAFTGQYKNLDTRGKRQFEDILEETTLMFNDETISEEDKEKILMAIQGAFFDAKNKNKRKK